MGVLLALNRGNHPVFPALRRMRFRFHNEMGDRSSDRTDDE